MKELNEFLKVSKEVDLLYHITKISDNAISSDVNKKIICSIIFLKKGPKIEMSIKGPYSNETVKLKNELDHKRTKINKLLPEIKFDKIKMRKSNNKYRPLFSCRTRHLIAFDRYETIKVQQLICLILD